jgi:hypothetical protein
MRQVRRAAQAKLQNFVRRNTVDAGDKADAAAVVLKGGVVQAAGWRKFPVHAGTQNTKTDPWRG